MYNLKWSESEKKLSRRVFEAALQAELADIIAKFKAKAAAVTTPDEMWAVQEFLAKHQREIEQKYDYRYSQLLLVFGKLVRKVALRWSNSTDCPTRSSGTFGTSPRCESHTHAIQFPTARRLSQRQQVTDLRAGAAPIVSSNRSPEGAQRIPGRERGAWR